MSAANFSYSLSSYFHTPYPVFEDSLSTHSVHYLCLPGPVALFLLLGYFCSLSLVSASALTHNCPQPSSQSDPITRCQKMLLSYTNPSSGFQLTQRGGLLWSMSPLLLLWLLSFLPQWPPSTLRHIPASASGLLYLLCFLPQKLSAQISCFPLPSGLCPNISSSFLWSPI